MSINLLISDIYDCGWLAWGCKFNGVQFICSQKSADRHTHEKIVAENTFPNENSMKFDVLNEISRWHIIKWINIGNPKNREWVNEVRESERGKNG